MKHLIIVAVGFALYGVTGCSEPKKEKAEVEQLKAQKDADIEKLDRQLDSTKRANEEKLAKTKAGIK